MGEATSLKRSNLVGRYPWLAVILILGLSLSLLLAGCSQEGSGPTPSDNSHQQTITITDCVGRQVTIPTNPQRIACLCPESGHAVAMFGQGDKIVAAVGGMQRDVILVEMHPHIKNVSVPKSSGVINIEELAACKPDIVFVKGDTARNEAEVDKMDKMGIPFLVVEFNSMQEQQKAMAMIGQAVGAAEKAEKYNKYYQQCVDQVAKKVADIPEKDRVRIFHSVNEAIRTDTAGACRRLDPGGRAINVSVGKELKLYEGKNYASLEQILLWIGFILVNDPTW